MIYTTIILVAIIIAVTVLGIKYLSVKYNSDLYERTNVEGALDIINGLLYKYDIYDNADEKERYKFSVSDKDVKTTLNFIKAILIHDNNN